MRQIKKGPKFPASLCIYDNPIGGPQPIIYTTFKMHGMKSKNELCESKSNLRRSMRTAFCSACGIMIKIPCAMQLVSRIEKKLSYVSVLWSVPLLSICESHNSIYESHTSQDKHIRYCLQWPKIKMNFLTYNHSIQKQVQYSKYCIKSQSVE